MHWYLGKNSVMSNPVDLTGEDALDLDVLMIRGTVGERQGVPPWMKRVPGTKGIHNRLSFFEPAEESKSIRKQANSMRAVGPDDGTHVTVD